MPARKAMTIGSLTTAAAPKRPRPRKGMVGTTLPPGALALVDSLVGTFIGGTRSELLRYIVISWITNHYTEIKSIAGTRP